MKKYGPISQFMLILPLLTAACVAETELETDAEFETLIGYLSPETKVLTIPDLVSWIGPDDRPRLKLGDEFLDLDIAEETHVDPSGELITLESAVLSLDLAEVSVEQLVSSESLLVEVNSQAAKPLSFDLEVSQSLDESSAATLVNCPNGFDVWPRTFTFYIGSHFPWGGWACTYNGTVSLPSGIRYSYVCLRCS